jgi:hypothetical protein
MSTRQRMTHRATVQRATTVTDAYGLPGPPTWADHIAALACYFYEPSGQRGEQIGERNADLYSHRLLAPAGTDVTEEDRIAGIVDRRGETVTDAVFDIKQIVRKPDHLLLVLEAVQS